MHEEVTGLEGALRPHCCCCSPCCCLAPPTRGGPAPAGCGHARPWPAPPSGPTRGQAPAPRSRAGPRAPAPSCGTAEAAPSPASRAGPADPCREKSGQWAVGREGHRDIQVRRVREEGRTDGGRQKDRRTEREPEPEPDRGRRPQKGGSGPASPDFPDVLLGHLHVDDDGVDLVLDQLPHAPRAQLQQAVLLLRGQGYILLWPRDTNIPAPHTPALGSIAPPLQGPAAPPRRTLAVREPRGGKAGNLGK